MLEDPLKATKAAVAMNLMEDTKQTKAVLSMPRIVAHYIYKVVLHNFIQYEVASTGHELSES